jgi:coatomer subunit beta'
MLHLQVWSVDLPKCNYNLPGFFNEVNFLEFFTRDDQQYLIITVSHDKTAKVRSFIKQHTNSTTFWS